MARNRDRAGEQDVIDRLGQLVEKPLEPIEVGGVEGSDTGAQLLTYTLQSLRIARRDDQLGSLVASEPSSLKSDASAAAYDDEDLFRRAPRVAPAPLRRSRLHSRRWSRWELCPGLLRHHVRRIPLGPVLIGLTGALLVFAVGSSRPPERSFQVRPGRE